MDDSNHSRFSRNSAQPIRACPTREGMMLLELLVVIAILALLAGLLLPAVQSVRAASQRAACMKNLKDIGLALHGYHNANGSFPSGCSYRRGLDPQPHLSWLARLLPYIEQEALWRDTLQAFQQERFFERQPHLPILGQRMAAFLCPADDRSQAVWEYESFQVAFTDYLGVEGNSFLQPDGVLFLDSHIRLSEVTDGAAHTLVVGERPPSQDRSLGWWYAGWGQSKTGSADMILGVREIRTHPRYWKCPYGPYAFEDGRSDPACDAFHFWSFHPSGANFAFADGSVRFLSYSADPIMPALATRAGGETVSVPE